jgi:hypothetical protein
MLFRASTPPSQVPRFTSTQRRAIARVYGVRSVCRRRATPLLVDQSGI